MVPLGICVPVVLCILGKLASVLPQYLSVYLLYTDDILCIDLYDASIDYIMLKLLVVYRVFLNCRFHCDRSRVSRETGSGDTTAVWDCH